MTEPSQDRLMPTRAKLADWLNAFKADPFSTGEAKVDRLLEIIGEASRPTTDVSTDGLVEEINTLIEDMLFPLFGAGPYEALTEKILAALQRSNAEMREALRACRGKLLGHPTIADVISALNIIDEACSRYYGTDVSTDGLVERLFDIARTCFHYAPRGTPDGTMFERSEQGRMLKNAIVKIAPTIEALQRSNAGKDEALRPFGCDDFEHPVADENGWTDFGIAWSRDRIVDWFGPSAFRHARKALSHSSEEADAVHQ